MAKWEINDEWARRITLMWRWMRNLRVTGAVDFKNTEEACSIFVRPSPPPAAADPVPEASLKFGVMVGTWDTGDNAVTLTPCLGATDSTPTGDDDVAAYIQFPVNKAAPAFGGVAGDILAYQEFGAINVLVGPPILPRSTQKFEVLTNNADSGNCRWMPDFVRARGTP